MRVLILLRAVLKIGVASISIGLISNQGKQRHISRKHNNTNMPCPCYSRRVNVHSIDQQ